jgi:uncharacterized integral membrane protein
MRASIAFFVGIITTIVAAMFVMLVVQNAQVAKLAFLGGSVVGAAGALLALAAIVGFALALLIVIPGRMASAALRRAQARQLADTQERLTTMREKYAELHGDYQRLFEEHERLMSHIAIIPAPGGEAQVEANHGAQPQAPARQDAVPLRRTGPLYPPGHPPHLFDDDASSPPVPAAPPSALQRMQERAQAEWRRVWARIRRHPAEPESRSTNSPQDSSAA